MANPGLTTDSSFTQSMLRRLFEYDLDSGALLWRSRSGNMRWWNAKYAGKPAGHAHSSSGYVLVKLRGRIYLAHRLIWILTYGQRPVGEIDHINRDRQDNRLENLRDVSRSQNMRNRDQSLRNGVGVSRIRKNGRWRAYFTVNGKPKHIGSYATRDEALAARQGVVEAYSEG